MSQGEGQKRRGNDTVARRRVVLGAAIFAVLALLGLGIVYGPQLLSGNYHRAAIERLASNAFGRPVKIGGTIMLSLLPDPQLRAEDVTIGGARGTRITAATLKLDLQPGPLLLGRLRASRLTLNKPDITLPWPLPGGVSAIAPPPWLASLHATINDGTLKLGPLHIDHANLSIFTGGPHAVITASGPVRIDGIDATTRLDLADTGSSGPVPVVASLKFQTKGTAHFDFRGTFDHASVLTGRLTFTLDPKAAASLLPKGTDIAGATASGNLTATGALITWRNVTAASGRQRFNGDAALILRPAPLLRLEGNGSNLVLDQVMSALTRAKQTVPVVASIDLAGTSAGKLAISKARTVLLADVGGTRIQTLEAMLPGGAKLSFAGSLATPLHGAFSLDAPDPGATLAALRSTYPFLPGWPEGFGPLSASGQIKMRNSGTINLESMQGRVAAGAGGSDFTGALRVSPAGDRADIAALVNFNRLAVNDRALEALGAALSTGKPNLVGPISVTANRFVWEDRAGHAATTRLDAHNLLIDAAVHRDGGVAVPLASLDIGRALLAGHGTWAPDGGIDSARVSFTGPDAHTAFRALARASGVATGWTVLPAFHKRFAVGLAAAGPVNALHAGITLHLGNLRVATTPTVNLATGHAAGPLTLRAPNAAALIRSLGGTSLLGARSGLGWPGPGSASLRASVFLAGDRLGLSDFAASLGALAARGRLDLDTSNATPRISGRIAADTLAIPAPDALIAFAHAALGSRFQIDLPHVSATRIDRFGVTVAADTAFSLALRHDRLAPSVTLRLNRAAVAGGTLRGDATLTAAAPAAPPTLSVNCTLTGAHATGVAALATDFGLKLPLSEGTLELGTNLTAAGSDPRAWRTTLTGSLTGSGKKLVVNDIDLGRAGLALAAATAADHPVGAIATASALRDALKTGSTEFDLLDLTATIANSRVTLNHATLTGPHGTLAASGKADFAPGRIDLTITAHPTVDGHKTSPALSVALAGEATHPTARSDISPAIAWIAAHRTNASVPPPDSQTGASAEK